MNPSPNPEARIQYGVILAGGESKRMGQDKAALILPGTSETLLGRTIRLVGEVGLTPVVIGRLAPPNAHTDDGSAGQARFFPDDPLPPKDSDSRRGPLAGLQTALARLRAPVLALACDMPLLTGEVLRFVLSHVGACGKHGLVLSKEQPLCGIYQPTCLPLILELLQHHERRQHSLRRLLAIGDFAEASAPAELLSQLVSANTQAEFVRLVGPPC